MAKRIVSYVFLAVFSLGYLSVGPQLEGSRRIACVDTQAEANVLPLSGSLFGEIQDEALKKSISDYYLFLSRVEMQALASRQSIRALYGINDNTPWTVAPTIHNFDLSGNTFANGYLWGQLQVTGTQSFYTAGANLSPMAIQPYNPGLAAGGTVAGIAFPGVNAANHKVGTF